ncbi:cellulose synthase operon protein YhjQ/BcsQ, partial [Yinghuangia sp. YIM S09857]|uniref:cellulose synthase operon protein YhjQ/BcsQ n=1 Tax=Yinghuangia sp. YIM S09857 TaxID=3436929 RepID=UPI003F535F28
MSAPGNWQQDVFRDITAALEPPASGPAEPPGPRAAFPSGANSAAPAALTRPVPPKEAEPAVLPSRRSPAPVPVTAPEFDSMRGPVRRGDPRARRAVHLLRRGLASSPSAEAASLADVVRRIQQPITTGRQIAVSGVRGGAGKSTVAALLALTLGHYRTDSVLAVEADGALGTLPVRLGATEVQWSCADLAEAVDASTPLEEVTRYLLPFSGGRLLPGSRGLVTRSRLAPKTYWMAMAALRRHFAATVVDCESLPAEVARLAICAAQSRVLVSPTTVEGIRTTRLVLDWLDTVDPVMLPTTVVALVQGSPDAAVDAKRAASQLAVRGIAMVEVPYDRSLAVGGVIDTGRLARATRDAAARLAAEAMDRAV